MNIQFSDHHEAFRTEVRRFLDDNLTDELRDAQKFTGGMMPEYKHNIRWHRILYKKGWIAPSWPKQYGGTGWDLTQRYIYTTETTAAGAPHTAPMGLGMCGPMLIGHGTEEQKAHYLPRILSGEDYWCQGYSEPGSGSDLASLKLRAESDGDHYVLNGSKIWTTHAHFANRMFCLVRTRSTDKPQQGITFLLLDMKSPGIKVEPIIFSSGTHEVNQVFFEDVRVPKANVVGEEDRGWTVAKYLLEFERGGGGAAGMQTALKRVRRLAALTEQDGTTLADEADFKRKLDEADVELQSIQYLEFRIMASLSQGQNPGPESSIMKNLSANMSQKISHLLVEVMSEYAGVHQPNARDVGQNVPIIGPVDGAAAFTQYMDKRSSSIAGGSNEVQKNIVSKLVLGL